MKGIIFNKYGLEDKVIDSTKTITFRPITIPDTVNGIEVCGYTKWENCYGQWSIELIDEDEREIEGSNLKSPYERGEIVAIKQSYCDIDLNFLLKHMDYNEIYNSKAYRNKMFANPDYMPHHIQIINVYPQRIQNIDTEDCLNAGIIKYNKNGNCRYVAPNIGYWRGLGLDDFSTAQEAYGKLINKIYGDNVWEINDMWWKIEFKTID